MNTDFEDQIQLAFEMEMPTIKRLSSPPPSVVISIGIRARCEDFSGSAGARPSWPQQSRTLAPLGENPTRSQNRNCCGQDGRAPTGVRLCRAVFVRCGIAVLRLDYGSHVQQFVLALCFALLAGCGTEESNGRRPRFGNAASTKPTIAAPKPAPPVQAPRGPRRPMIDLSESVGIVGPVRRRVVSWEEGMTVASALVAAEYLGADNPREIYINRRGVIIPVNVRKLLRNLENPTLEAGDILEVRP